MTKPNFKYTEDDLDAEILEAMGIDTATKPKLLELLEKSSASYAPPPTNPFAKKKGAEVPPKEEPKKKSPLADKYAFLPWGK